MKNSKINDLCCLIDDYLNEQIGPDTLFILHVAHDNRSYTSSNLPTLREVPRILRAVSERIEMESIRNN